MSPHASAARVPAQAGRHRDDEHEPQSAAGAFLLCEVGTHLCALPLESVVETMRPLPIEALAGVPPFVRGLSVIRGVPVPVIDAGHLINDEASESTRYVMLRAGDQRIALAVNSVLGVRTIGAQSFKELPQILRDARAPFIAAIGAHDAQLLLVLRAARILPETLRGSLGIAEPGA